MSSRDLLRVLDPTRSATGRLWDLEPFAERVEPVPVFGEVDRVGARTQHRDAGLLERVGELQRRLPAERDHDAGQLTCPLHPAHQRVADVADSLGRERLEEEPVARVVVGGDRLGVAVDHHGLVAGLGECERGVDAAVVELDSLTDPVRSAAEDDDGGPRGRRHLVLVFVGGVVVRGLRRELGCARVDRLVRARRRRPRSGQRGRRPGRRPRARRAARRRSRAASPAASRPG